MGGKGERETLCRRRNLFCDIVEKADDIMYLSCDVIERADKMSRDQQTEETG